MTSCVPHRPRTFGLRPTTTCTTSGDVTCSVGRANYPLLWACDLGRLDNVMSADRHLGAILLSPPLTTGVRTLRAVTAAAEALHCRPVSTANLMLTPTRDIRGVAGAGASVEPWLAARPKIVDTIAVCDVLIFAWGLLRVPGSAGRHHAMQTNWLTRQAMSHGHKTAWTLDGEPRHPSRWHQYVSDKYARTCGGSFAQRLGLVLKEVPLQKWCVEGSPVIP